MKKNNQKIERYRVKSGRFRSTEEYGNNGIFLVTRPKNKSLVCIASDGEGWEHVSVTYKYLNKCPSWEAMCLIKDLFWDEDETVIQYHPPKSDYVNMHPYVLHLWKPIDIDLPRPPKKMVGWNLR